MGVPFYFVLILNLYKWAVIKDNDVIITIPEMLRTASRDCVLDPEYRWLQRVHRLGTMKLAHLSGGVCIILIGDNAEINYRGQCKP